MKNRSPKYRLPVFGRLLRDAYRELAKNDPLRMAGATAFFTTFALPPILIIIIQVLGLVYNPRKISIELFHRLEGIIGVQSVRQLFHTLIAIRKLAQNWFITIGGFIFLIFVATTLFKVITGSLNQVWKIKVVVSRSVWFSLQNRIQSVMVILGAALLFVAGLFTETALAVLGKYLRQYSPGLASYSNSVLNQIIAVAIVTCWFAILFRFLPDGRPRWKIALAGALLTSVLFNVGKLILKWMLQYSNIKTVYGASGSIVLLLLFVFYSSLILYYGAAFTKVWGAFKGKPIRPLPHAIHYELVEVNIGK